MRHQKPLSEKWTRLWQLENPYSHWTIGLADHWFLFLLAIYFVAHLIFAAYLPATEDELYYWAWAKDLRLGYFDHPPMVAYLTALSTKIFGNNLFGIRFFAILIGTIVIAIVGLQCRQRFLLLLFMLTPAGLLGSFLMTPDLPLILFWTLYALWLIPVNEALMRWSDDPVSRVYHQNPISFGKWFLGGVLLGLGLLSKYTMLLVLPCTFMMFLLNYRRQAWLMGFSVHVVVALLVALPIVYHNFEFDFEPFLFQWRHGMDASGVSFESFWSFLGGQILITGLLPILGLPWVMLHVKDFTSDAKLRGAYYLYVLPLLFFIFQSFRKPIEANWPIIAYICFWPLVSRLTERSMFPKASQIVAILCFVVPVGASLLFFVHLSQPLEKLPPRKDRIGKFIAQFETSQRVAKALPKGVPLYSPTYQWTAYFRYQNLVAHQLHPLGRKSAFTQTPTDPCQFPTIYTFVSGYPHNEEISKILSCFDRSEKIQDFEVNVRDQDIVHYTLAKHSKAE